MMMVFPAGQSMMRPRSDHFILETFDRELWCPIAQTRFHVDDITALRAILGQDADDDPELSHCQSRVSTK